MPHRFITLLFVALTGCGSPHIRIDGGSPSDGAVPTGELTVESESTLALVFGERVELLVRYTEDGSPVSGVPVRFALEGMAHDSTLGDLTASTDAQGRASNAVTAGSTATVFRVRVSAERAAPIYVDVSVGNMGFGSLRVGAAYDGARQGTRRVIRVHPGLGCEDELPTTGGLIVTLDDPAVTEARFRALPAGLRYAVVGHVEGPMGVEVARGCVDGVEVARDVETRVSLAFTDEPLALAGDFRATVALDLTSSSDALRELVTALGAARIDASGSDAALYLDALDAELRERGHGELADALALERASAEASLALELADAGPHPALLALAARLRDRLAAMELSGPLTVSVDDAPAAGWELTSIALGVDADPDTPPLRFDATDLAPTASLALRWGAELDALALERLDVTLPLGALADAALVAEAGAAGHTAPARLLVGGAGCEALAAWVTDHPTLAPFCGAECAESACDLALSAVMDTVRGGLVALDSLRDRVELTGRVWAHDDDGDLSADRWASDRLEGRFVSAVDRLGDPVAAELVGERALRD